jgi:hypothetical protein
VEYPEANELYDIALSALADAEGNVLLTKKEAEETLKHFIDAVADIQEAYARAIPSHYGKDEEFTVKGRKKRPALQGYVLDTGMAVRLLQGFHVDRMKYGTSLQTFINKALQNTFEVEDTDDDKKLARFILAKHGFLNSAEISAQLGLDYSDGNLKPDILPVLPQEKISEAQSLIPLAPQAVAKLDPYGNQRKAIDNARTLQRTLLRSRSHQ